MKPKTLICYKEFDIFYSNVTLTHSSELFFYLVEAPTTFSSPLDRASQNES